MILIHPGCKNLSSTRKHYAFGDRECKGQPNTERQVGVTLNKSLQQATFTDHPHFHQHTVRAHVKKQPNKKQITFLGKLRVWIEKSCLAASSIPSFRIH